LSAEVDLKTADAFGPVRGAVLYVQGPVFKAFLGPRGFTTARHLCKLFVNVDGDVASNNNQAGKAECITPHSVHLDFNYPGPDPVTVYSLLVMTTIPDHLQGLLLVPQGGFSTPGKLGNDSRIAVSIRYRSGSAKIHDIAYRS
jgi:hypothetical protein